MATSRRADWDPTSPDVLDDQRTAFDGMRERCPVAYSELQGWTLFRHRDVEQVVHDPEAFSNVVSRHVSVPNGMDPPEHTRFRRLIEPYFSESRVARFEPTCRSIAASLLGDLDAGGDVEVMGALARPFAATAQCAFLGWPKELAPALVDWTLSNQQATLEQDRRELARLAGEFQAYVIRALEARRSGNEADADTTGRLMGETVYGRRLHADEIGSILRNWTVGEIGTLSAAIGILVHAIARGPSYRTGCAGNRRCAPTP